MDDGDDDGELDDIVGQTWFDFAFDDSGRTFSTGNDGTSLSVWRTTTPGRQELEATYDGTFVPYLGVYDPAVAACWTSTIIVDLPPEALAGAWTDAACP